MESSLKKIAEEEGSWKKAEEDAEEAGWKACRCSNRKTAKREERTGAESKEERGKAKIAGLGT